MKTGCFLKIFKLKSQQDLIQILSNTKVFQDLNRKDATCPNWLSLTKKPIKSILVAKVLSLNRNQVLIFDDSDTETE